MSKPRRPVILVLEVFVRTTLTDCVVSFRPLYLSGQPLPRGTDLPDSVRHIVTSTVTTNFPAWQRRHKLGRANWLGRGGRVSFGHVALADRDRLVQDLTSALQRELGDGVYVVGHPHKGINCTIGRCSMQ